MSSLRRDVTVVMVGLVMAGAAATPAVAGESPRQITAASAAPGPVFPGPGTSPEDQIGGPMACMPFMQSLGPLGPMGPWGPMGPHHGEQKPEPRCSFFGPGPRLA